MNNKKNGIIFLVAGLGFALIGIDRFERGDGLMPYVFLVSGLILMGVAAVNYKNR